MTMTTALAESYVPLSLPELGEIWERVKARLQAQHGEAVYRNWLKPITLLGMQEGLARLSVPTKFMREWIQ